MDFDVKSVFAIAATVVSAIGFYPYLRDIFRRKTEPHIYTWLIWLVTQGVAVAGVWYGGGAWGAVNLTVGLLFVLAVFLLSFKYGTRNITVFDSAMLAIALLAVLAWWKLDSPVLAVLIATGADMIGYLPTMRKSYFEPWSETVSTWLLFVLANLLSLFALSEFNTLTMTYIVAIAIANLLVTVLCIVRRSSIPRP